MEADALHNGDPFSERRQVVPRARESADGQRVSASFSAAACGVLALALAGCLPFLSRDTGPSLFDLVRAVGEAPARVDSIWPGYSLREQGFLLYEPGGSALLVTSSSPPPGFAPVADSLVPGPLRGRIYAHEGGLPGLEGGVDTEYRIGGLVRTAYSPGSSLGAALATLYHEAFHRYQRDGFASAGPVDESVPAGALTREFAAMAEVERRMLARALELGSGPALDSLVVALLAVRHERLRDVPPRVREVERALERLEGSAHLVGYELAAATLGYEPGRVVSAVREYLTVPLDRFGGDRATQLMRWRAYGTGAAMGILLDRKRVAWRDRLAAGSPFDALLAGTVAPDRVGEAERAGEAEVAGGAERARASLEAFGYDAILDDIAEAPTPREEVDAFFRQAPVRFVLEVAPRDTAIYEAGVAFDFSSGFLDRLLGRRRGMSQPEPRLTLIWNADILHTTDPARAGFSLRVDDRPVALDFRAGGSRVRYVVLLPELPRVNGREARAGRGGEIGRESFSDGVVIEGEGLRFRTDLSAALVVFGSDSIRVRISP